MSKYVDAGKMLSIISHLLGAMPMIVVRWCEINSIDIVRCKKCKYRKNRIDYEKDYCIKHSKVLYDTGGGCSWGKE